MMNITAPFLCVAPNLAVKCNVGLEYSREMSPVQISIVSRPRRGNNNRNLLVLRGGQDESR